MRFNGFVGPSYESRSVVPDCQRTVNLFPEANESGTGKSPVSFYKVPGYAELCDLDSAATQGGWVRKMMTVNDRLFAMVDASAYTAGGLYEIYSDGTFSLVVTWAALGFPFVGAYTMASDGTQILIGNDMGPALDGLMTCVNLTTWAVTQIAAPYCNWVAFHPDGYFLGLDRRSKKLYISALYDATSWDLADTTVVTTDGFPIAMIVDHQEIWIFCDTKTIIYQDTGNADFPFEPIRGATIETGIMGHTACRLDNSVFWLGRDERGHSVVWRADGYRPVRVSNHAIEYFIDNVIGDPVTLENSIVAWTYQEDGHQFYLLNAGSAATTTLVYDAATNMWHERAWYDSGALGALWLTNHVFVWGKHIISGYSPTGVKIYEQSRSYLDHDGIDIHWLRRAPHLANEGKRSFFDSLMIDFVTGEGGGGGDPAVANSTVYLRWSDDGGRTWSSYLTATLGAAGAYKTRVRWNRLGMARDRVFEVSGNEAARICIVDAFLDVTGGNN